MTPTSRRAPTAWLSSPTGRSWRRPDAPVTALALHTRLALAGLVRNPAKTLLRISVVAIAVALLAGMLLFVGDSLRTASGTAVRDVPLDWQGPVASYGQAQRAVAAASRQPGVAQASATATAPFAAATHAGSGGKTTTGKGAVL